MEKAISANPQHIQDARLSLHTTRIGRLEVAAGIAVTDRQSYPSTVTLAANAHRMKLFMFLVTVSKFSPCILPHSL